MAPEALKARPQVVLVWRNMHLTRHYQKARGLPFCLPPATVHWKRSFAAARNAPRFRVPAHVAAFSVLLTPVVLYFAFYERFGDEQHLQEELREKYADEVRAAASKNRHMAEFFQRTFRNLDGSADDKIDGLIKAGRGAKKRLHAVDETLYGTAEGAAERQRMEEELQQKRKERKAGPTSSDKTGLNPGLKPTIDSKRNERAPRAPSKESDEPLAPLPWTRHVGTVAPYAGVALVAAAVGFLAGGSSKRS